MTQKYIRSEYNGTVVLSNIRKGRASIPVIGMNDTYTATKVTEWYDGTPMTPEKVDGSVYLQLKDTGEYFKVNLPNEGETYLEKDTMGEMRGLSGIEVLLLKMNYYKGVKLNGYYEKGDTPTPIEYYLSNTIEEDDGGSIILVGNIILEHLFKGEVNIKYYGSREGDEIQDEANKILRKYKILKIPTGEYIIDVTKQVDSLGRKGIVMVDNSSLHLDADTQLKAKDNSDGRYSLIDVVDVQNVNIKGGVLIGDRDNHSGTTGEWGHGINLWSSSNVRIENVNIKDFWGDGIYLGGVDGTSLYGAGTITSEEEARPSTNISIINVKIDNCRRQGISIVCCKDSLLDKVHITRTNGIAPESLIDIEPNRRAGERYGYVENINIKNSTFERGATQGITFYHLDESEFAIRDISINNSRFIDNGSTHLAVRRASNVVVESCYFKGSEDSGSGGQVALSGKKVDFRNNTVIKNTSGNYGVRVWSEGVSVDVNIENNNLHQSEGSFFRIEGDAFEQVNIINNTLEGSVINNFNFKTEGNYYNINIISNIIKANSSSFFQLNPSSIFENIKLYKNKISSNNNPIDIRDNWSYIILKGNIFKGLQGTAVTINGSREVEVSDNTFIECDGARVVYITGASDSVIKGNSFFNCEPANEAVSVTNSVLQSIIKDNIFKGDSYDKVPYRISGTSGRIVTGNSVYGYTQRPVIPPTSLQNSNSFDNEELSLATTQRYGVVKQTVVQENSTAEDLSGLVSDFNSLLNKLKSAGIMDT